MKGAAKTELQKLITGIKNGSIQMSGNEPKMSIRALRTLLLSGDEVHGELVEQFLSGKLNVEQFKNKLRGASETRIPKPLRRIPSDRIHHMTPLEIANIVEDMPDNELLTMLQDFEKEDYYFGDTDENVRGGSFDERAHTGARPKASKSKIVYPNELGEPGLREMSAHPRGTRDTMFDIDARPTTAVEGRKVITPLLEQGKEDIQRGIIADTPRRSYINDQLVKQGVIEKGVDIFSSDIDDATLKRAAPYLKSPEMQEGAALAFKTPKPNFNNGSMRMLRTGAMVAGGVGALGIIGDVVQAKEGVEDIVSGESEAEKVAGGLNTAGAAIGLAGFAANPVTAIPAVVLSGYGGAIKTRIKQDRVVKQNFRAADPKVTTAVDPYENQTQIIQAPKKKKSWFGLPDLGLTEALGIN